MGKAENNLGSNGPDRYAKVYTFHLWFFFLICQRVHALTKEIQRRKVRTPTIWNSHATILSPFLLPFGI